MFYRILVADRNFAFLDLRSTSAAAWRNDPLVVISGGASLAFAGAGAFSDDSVSEVRIGRASVEELGFTSQTTTARICGRIREFGFGVCTASDAWRIRLAFRDQGSGEYLFVPTDPFLEVDSKKYVATVFKGVRTPNLRLGIAPADQLWGLSRQVAFRLP